MFTFSGKRDIQEFLASMTLAQVKSIQIELAVSTRDALEKTRTLRAGSPEYWRAVKSFRACNDGLKCFESFFNTGEFDS